MFLDTLFLEHYMRNLLVERARVIKALAGSDVNADEA